MKEARTMLLCHKRGIGAPLGKRSRYKALDLIIRYFAPSLLPTHPHVYTYVSTLHITMAREFCKALGGTQEISETAVLRIITIFRQILCSDSLWLGARELYISMKAKYEDPATWNKPPIYRKHSICFSPEYRLLKNLERRGFLKLEYDEESQRAYRDQFVVIRLNDMQWLDLIVTSWNNRLAGLMLKPKVFYPEFLPCGVPDLYSEVMEQQANVERMQRVNLEIICMMIPDEIFDKINSYLLLK